MEQCIPAGVEAPGDVLQSGQKQTTASIPGVPAPEADGGQPGFLPELPGEIGDVLVAKRVGNFPDMKRGFPQEMFGVLDPALNHVLERSVPGHFTKYPVEGAPGHMTGRGHPPEAHPQAGLGIHARHQAADPVVQFQDPAALLLVDQLQEDLLHAMRRPEMSARELESAYDKAEAYCRAVRQYSASPGNFAGGLTTIEEKSLGAFAKSGSRPIRGILPSSTRPPSPGLWLLDTVPDKHFMQFGYTNPNDSEGITALVSCGCHIVLFVTGRGSVIGSPVAPLLKITGNAETYRFLEEDMDFDASGPLYGLGNLTEAGGRLFEHIIRVAAGEETKPERWGHHEYCIPYKHQEPCRIS